MEAGDFDLIFIDNFDRIGKTKGVENAYESDNHKIKTILTFSKENQIPIGLVHHINSKRPSRDGGYNLSDMRGSGKITDECNTVMFVARDTRDDISDEDKSKFFLQVKKHRRKGQLASAVLDFRAGEFFDIAPHLTPEFWQP
jgi:replicative DNA helicase